NGGENFNTFSVGKAIIGNNDVKINIHKDNGKPVIEIVEKQPLILSQLPGAGKLEEYNWQHKNDDKAAVSKLALLDIGIEAADGKHYADKQRVNFTISDLRSTATNLSGNFANTNIKFDNKLTGDLPLYVQVNGNDPVAFGGLTIKGQKQAIFDNKGNLSAGTKFGGFWGVVENQRYTSIFRDAAQKEAILDINKAIRWNEEGMLTAQSMKNLVGQKIWTAADPAKGYEIKAFEPGANGKLSVTAEKGLYSFFVAGGSNKTDNETQGANTIRKAVNDIKITKDGNWKGQASFYLDQFSAAFSGSVSPDLRNYSGTSDYKGKLPYIHILNDKQEKIGNHALVLGKSSKFAFDKEGRLAEGVLYDGLQRKEFLGYRTAQRIMDGEVKKFQNDVQNSNAPKEIKDKIAAAIKNQKPDEAVKLWNKYVTDETVALKKKLVDESMKAYLEGGDTKDMIEAVKIKNANFEEFNKIIQERNAKINFGQAMLAQENIALREAQGKPGFNKAAFDLAKNHREDRFRKEIADIDQKTGNVIIKNADKFNGIFKNAEQNVKTDLINEVKNSPLSGQLKMAIFEKIRLANEGNDNLQEAYKEYAGHMEKSLQGLISQVEYFQQYMDKDSLTKIQGLIEKGEFSGAISYWNSIKPGVEQTFKTRTNYLARLGDKSTYDGTLSGFSNWLGYVFEPVSDAFSGAFNLVAAGFAVVYTGGSKLFGSEKYANRGWELAGSYWANSLGGYVEEAFDKQAFATRQQKRLESSGYTVNGAQYGDAHYFQVSKDGSTGMFTDESFIGNCSKFIESKNVALNVVGYIGKGIYIGAELFISKKIGVPGITRSTYAAAILTDGVANFVSTQFTGKALRGGDDMLIGLSFVTGSGISSLTSNIASRVVVNGSNAFVAAAQRTLAATLRTSPNWINFNLATGHVLTAPSGRAMGFGDSLFNIGSTYAFTGAFQGVWEIGKGIGRAVPKVYSYLGNKITHGSLYQKMASKISYMGQKVKETTIVQKGISLAETGSLKMENVAVKAAELANKIAKNKFVAASGKAIDFGRNVTATGLKNFGKYSGVNNPLQFLAGSTAVATTEISSPVALHDALGGGSALLSPWINPGRNIVTSVTDYIDKGISDKIAGRQYAERNKFDSAVSLLDDKLGSTGIISFALSGTQAFVDSYTQALSGSYSVAALSHPVQAVEDTLRFADIMKDLLKKDGNVAPDANSAQYGRLFGSLYGTTKGFRNLAGNIRGATNAPEVIVSRQFNKNMIQVAKFSEGASKVYARLAPVQKFGYFAAKSHSSAASLMKFNTGIGLLLPVINSKDTSDFSKQVYNISYSMDSFARSSVAAATLFNSLGALSGKVSNSAVVKAMGQNKGVQFFAKHPFTTLALPGASLIAAGTELGSLKNNESLQVLGNYMANIGLVLVGIGLMRIANGWKAKVEAIKPGSFLDKAMGVKAEGVNKLLYNSVYSAGGGLAFAIYGASKGDIHNFTDAAAYLSIGALAGLGLRKATTVVPLAAEVVGASALVYGVRKAAVEPGIAGVELWLDGGNVYDLAQLSRPSLFSEHPVREIQVYDGDMAKLVDKDSKTGLLKYPGREDVLITNEGRLVSNAGDNKGKYLYKEATYKDAQGKDKVYMVNDWLGAVMQGALLLSVFKVGKIARESYYKGPKQSLGAGKGLVNGALEYWYGKGNPKYSLATTFEFGKNHPVLSGLGIMGTGAGILTLGNADSLKNKSVGKVLQIAGVSLIGLGGISMIARA
ncbi:MAG: hypothetical protein WC561_05270, partial [Candidatus Omnitrophota bacterium]